MSHNSRKKPSQAMPPHRSILATDIKKAMESNKVGSRLHTGTKRLQNRGMQQHNTTMVGAAMPEKVFLKTIPRPSIGIGRQQNKVKLALK